MIFPIGDENVKGGFFPIITYGFITLNILVYFVFQATLDEQALSQFYDTYAGDPCELKAGEAYFTLITSIFLHGGLMHLLGNMLFLWIFGDNIEATIGNIRYIIFYLLGGIVATFAHVYLDGDTNCTPMVGASGAISAVIGSYLVMFPKSKIKLLVLFISNMHISAWIFIAFWIFQQFTGIFSALSGGGDNVAYWAHLGGLVFGVIAGFYFKTKFPVISASSKSPKLTKYQSVKIPPTRYNNRFINYNKSTS